MAENVKFYDVASRKAVMVPRSKCSVEVRQGKGRKVKMLTARGPKGNKLYRITK